MSSASFFVMWVRNFSVEVRGGGAQISREDGANTEDAEESGAATGLDVIGWTSDGITGAIGVDEASSSPAYALELGTGKVGRCRIGEDLSSSSRSSISNCGRAGGLTSL